MTLREMKALKPIKRTGDLAMVLAVIAIVFSTPGRLAAQPGVVPLYAFNGAYAAYRVSFGSYSQPYAVTITGVNPASRSFKVSIQVGKNPLLSPISEAEESFDRHPSFLALTTDELNRMRQGFVPRSLNRPGTQLEHGVVISVAAGKFNAEEVASPEAASWFDSSSGLLLKASGAANWSAVLERLGMPSGFTTVKPTIELVSTNVPTATSAETLPWVWIIVAVAVLVAVALGLYLLLRRRRRAIAVPNVVQTLPSAKPSTMAESLDKVSKLKALLDQGLITREDFERKKAQLLGL